MHSVSAMHCLQYMVMTLTDLSSFADLGGASATALLEPAQPEVSPGESATLAHRKHQPIQQGDMPMPHRNRDPIRSAIRKLFGRHKRTAVLSDTAQSLHEVSYKFTAHPLGYLRIGLLRQ